MKFKILLFALLQLNLICGAEVKESVTPIDIKNLSPSELGNLKAYDVLYAGFKDDVKDKSGLKRVESRISFLLKQPFHDLLYDFNLWHQDGINEIAFINAVKEVQRKLNEKVDGSLTFSQYQTIQNIANIYKTPKDINVGGNFRVRKIGDYAFVSGTLEIVNGEIANPINYHNMFLDKNSMTCRDSNLYVQENQGAFSGITIYSDVTEYEIISWGDEEVVCKNDYTCRSEKLIINFKSKSVDIITTNRDNDECKDLPKLNSARISRLVEPFKKCFEVSEKNKKLTRPFVADSASKLLKEMFKDE
jgi:hypothetical protein